MTGVGKSSLMLRYTDDIFTGLYISTIGVDFKTKCLTIGPYNCRMQIWDTAGQERFRVVTSTYYRGADGVIFVYDVSNRASFERVRKWISEIDDHCCNSTVAKVLVGNKCDSGTILKLVSNEEGSQLAYTLNIPFFETSARDKINVICR
ncbi:hypothetical protein ACOME3_004282 [Neoechinorhynchus agilis]